MIIYIFLFFSVSYKISQQDNCNKNLWHQELERNFLTKTPAFQLHINSLVPAFVVSLLLLQDVFVDGERNWVRLWNRNLNLLDHFNWVGLLNFNGIGFFNGNRDSLFDDLRHDLVDGNLDRLLDGNMNGVGLGNSDLKNLRKD